MGRRKGTGLSTTGYTIFSAEQNKIVRQENPEAPFGELSRLIGLKWKTLDQDEKKEYEDRAKAKVAEATKVLEAKEKEEQKRKKESEMETESIGSDSNQAFNPSSPGQVALTYVAAPPQIAPTNHIATIARPVQSPVKAPLIGQVQQQVQVAPPPPPRPHQEIQSRTTGPFVTHPPKPTRVLHLEAYLRYMDGLDNGRPVQSKWDRLIARCHPGNVPNMNLPVHWLNSKGSHQSMKSALVQMKNVLLRDAININSYNE